MTHLRQVAACVLTYRRPNSLRATLASLARLRFDGELSVVVVENSPDGPGASVCSEAGRSFPWSLKYCRQPIRGIPQARNEAIRRSPQGTEAIVFVDDDVEPSPQWLSELVRVQAAHGAAVVTGPAIPRFVTQPADWVIRGRYFEPARRPTGTRMPTAYTNNVLVTKSTLQTARPWFDESMPLSGGTDVEYFSRVASMGLPIVWADEASVFETIPPSRACAAWLCRRSFRIALVRTALRRATMPPPASRVAAARSTVVALWRCVGALGRAPFAGRAAAVDSARWFAFASGILASYAGIKFEEYRRIHGT